MGVAGQMEAGAGIPEGEGTGQAAHRLLQLLHQCGHQEHRQSKQQGDQ